MTPLAGVQLELKRMTGKSKEESPWERSLLISGM
jgi:hypothetical protein